MNPVGILLAAGRGRRFDPTGERNKLLQRLWWPGNGESSADRAVPTDPVVPAEAGTQFPMHADDSVAAASARNLLSVQPRVIAVVAPDDGGVGDLLRALGCDVTVCPGADTGMAASLVHAIRHSLPGADAWLVALADMPFVLPSTLQSLRDALAAGAPIAAPVMAGRRGNPVGFGRQHLAALLALEGDQGARAIVKANPVTEIEVEDPGIFRDIDTGADL